jgi:hypothetical protein
MQKRCWLLFILAAGGLVGCNAHSTSPAEQTKAAVPAAGEIGSRLPDFSVTDLEGHPVSSS